jgi:vacuolar-type H+-ATPase subunit F/Vma7
MPRAAVIGEALRVQGFALAGAMVLAAEDAEQARAAWRSLPPDVAVVVLTGSAAAWLGEAARERPGVLLAAMPATGLPPAAPS